QSAAATARELDSTKDALAAERAARSRAQAVGDDMRRDLAEARQQLSVMEPALAVATRELDEQRTLGARLRGELDGLESERRQLVDRCKEGEAAKAQLAAEIAEARDALAERDRSLAELRSQVESERTAAAALRRDLDRADARLAELGRKRAASEDADRELAAELARLRDVAADRDRARAETQAQLERERQSTTELRRALKETEARLERLVRDHEAAEAARQELAQELARVRDVAAQSQRRIGELESELEVERAARERLQAARLGLGEGLPALPLSASPAEADQLEIDLSRALVEAAAPADPLEPAPAVESPAPGSLADPAPLDIAARSDRSEPKWQQVRAVERHPFAEPLSVTINGEPGFLFDLSVAGC